MSRLGKRPVPFDGKVKAEVKDGKLNVSGQNGNLDFLIPSGVEVTVNDGNISIAADFETSEGKTLGGTVRAIARNMVEGVTTGFTKTLNLVGVGYRAQVSGQSLVLNLGYSHPIDYALPKVVKATVEANTKVILTSCDKQVLGQVAAEIRKFRPPEPYKGKGILFEGEQIQRKAGKTGKK